MEQAGLIRAGRVSELDLKNIAEEIESVGKSEKRELVSRLTILLLHLLKWRFHSENRGNSWRNTIEVQRIRLASHIRDNPSMKSALDEAIEEAFRVARLDAETETNISRNAFPVLCPPVLCPWSFTQMMDENFWPDRAP